MKINHKLTALIMAIVLLLLFSSSAAAYDVVEPDGNYCMDKAGVISENTKTYIRERNKNLEANCSGAQMCVVVLKDIGYADIEEYAYDLFSSWKIGRAGEDNGVLILFVTGAENYWIMPGTGLEKILTTNVLEGVIRVYCEPSFAVGDYDTAAKKTFSRINELICSEYGANPEGIVSSSGSSGFTGGGSDQPISGYNGNSYHGWGCSDIQLPYYSCRSCASCLSCASCASCLFTCSGCGSCTGFWSIIGMLLLVYIVLQVLRGMGRGHVRRVSHAPGGQFGRGGFDPGPRPGGFNQGPRPGGFNQGPRPGGSNHGPRPGGARPSSGSGRPSFTGSSGSGRPSSAGGFHGGGGGSRSGGTGRTGGFHGGSGGSRGGGAGRR